jgi:hypothetical protein
MIEVFQTLSTGNASLSARFEAFLRAWLVCHLDDPHFLGGGKNSTYNAGNQHTLVHLFNNFCRADLRLHDEDNGIVWTNASATCGTGKTVQPPKPAEVPLSEEVLAIIQRSGATNPARHLVEEARRASASEKKQQAAKRQDLKKQAEALHASAARNQAAAECLQEAATAATNKVATQAKASKKRLAKQGEKLFNDLVRSAATPLAAAQKAKRAKLSAPPSRNYEDDDDDNYIDDDDNNNNDVVDDDDDYDD